MQKYLSPPVNTTVTDARSNDFNDRRDLRLLTCTHIYIYIFIRNSISNNRDNYTLAEWRKAVRVSLSRQSKRI